MYTIQQFIMDTRLTKNFKLSEFTKSETAQRLRIDNIPPFESAISLQALSTAILQPLRDEINSPIQITSGYRSDELNKAVGGKENSQHTLGQAADISSPQGLTIIIEAIRELGLDFDQMIVYAPRGFLHISYKRTGNNRGQIIYKS